MEIRAFNLVPGCVFSRRRIPGLGNLEVHIVREVHRYPGSKRVALLTWRQPVRVAEKLRADAPNLGYCDVVTLLGISVDPEDPGNQDFGVDGLPRT